MQRSIMEVLNDSDDLTSSVHINDLTHRVFDLHQINCSLVQDDLLIIVMVSFGKRASFLHRDAQRFNKIISYYGGLEYIIPVGFLTTPRNPTLAIHFVQDISRDVGCAHHSAYIL